MIVHHPSADLLADCARGVLAAGASLAVAVHVDTCALCRSEIALWERVGGVLLQEEAPSALAPDAFERTLARLEAPTPESKSLYAIPRYLEGFALPASLRAQRFGRRLWLTPNIWFARIAANPDSNARTYLMHGTAHTKLPLHTHGGREFTAVLHGAFADATGMYRKGDFAETDGAVTHAPTVSGDSDCLCLLSAEAPMRLFGPIAKAIQALSGRGY